MLKGSTFAPNFGSDNACFKISNMRYGKTINIRMFLENWLPIEDNAPKAGYDWFISCLITPIR